MGVGHLDPLCELVDLEMVSWRQRPALTKVRRVTPCQMESLRPAAVPSQTRAASLVDCAPEVCRLGLHGGQATSPESLRSLGVTLW